MQAVILAAGFGSRLRPLTETQPKCLTEVDGVSLLANELNLLSERNVRETIVVLGHMREKIVDAIGFQWKGMKITYVENSVYRETNNVFSLNLARNYVDDDFILLECDLFFQRDVLDALLESTENDCNILVSPFNAKTMNGTVVKVDDEGRVLELVLGKRQNADFNYDDALKTVNVYFFKKDFAIRRLFPLIEYYVETQSRKSYYELALGALVYWGNDSIKAISISEESWAEIDDLEDLARAEVKFGKSRSYALKFEENKERSKRAA